VTAQLIGIDWGTTSLRGYLISANGDVLDQGSSDNGVMAVPSNEFPAVLQESVAPWVEEFGPLPIVMSGMVGSRQGWVEVPYVRCPAEASDLATGVVRMTVEGLGPVIIVPGVEWSDSRGVPDVMRGEETQVLGALVDGKRFRDIYAIPGTHSKWVTTAGKSITSLRTYMTGEVYGALLHNTILGRLAEGEAGDGTGFSWGVKAGGTETGDPGALLSRLFATRTLGLSGDLAPTEIADYLSGVLIGAELATAASGPGAFKIIANQTLQKRYSWAADILGLTYATVPADCVALGHLQIARAAGLMSGAGA
jgi:2-dehydro-3-deoxygalactonokinase